MGVICNPINEIREISDQKDRKIVAWLAEREAYVTQATAFKKTTDEVKVLSRVEQVISMIKSLAQEHGANPGVVESVYHAMISAFIEAEPKERRPQKLSATPDQAVQGRSLRSLGTAFRGPLT